MATVLLAKWLLATLIVCLTISVGSSTLLEALYNSDEPLLLNEERSKKIAEDWAKGKSKNGQQHFLADIGYNVDYSDENFNQGAGSDIGQEANNGHQQETTNQGAGTDQDQITVDQTNVEQELKNVFPDGNKDSDECPEGIPAYIEYGNKKCATLLNNDNAEGKETVTVQYHGSNPTDHLINYLEETSGNRRPIFGGGISHTIHNQQKPGHFEDQHFTGHQSGMSPDTSFEDQFGSPFGHAEVVITGGSSPNEHEDQVYLDIDGQVTSRPERMEEQDSNFDQLSGQHGTNFDDQRSDYFGQVTQKPFVYQHPNPAEDHDRFREQETVGANEDGQQQQQLDRLQDQVSNTDQQSNKQDHLVQVHNSVVKPDMQELKKFDPLDYYSEWGLSQQGQEAPELADAQQIEADGNELEENLDQSTQQHHGTNQLTVSRDQTPDFSQVEQAITGPKTDSFVPNLQQLTGQGELSPLSVNRRPHQTEHQVIGHRPDYSPNRDILGANEGHHTGQANLGNYYPGGQYNYPQKNNDIIVFPDNDDDNGHKPWDHHNPNRPYNGHNSGNDYGFSCYGKKPGYYPSYEYNCQHFYRCGPDGRTYRFKCAKGTLFHSTILKCLHSGQVKCNPLGVGPV